MAKRKLTPEERELLAKAAQERREFEALVDRWRARLRADAERRERRRRMLRRLLPVRR